MIYFIRHGESEANRQGVFARDDVTLTIKGINQVKKAAKQILSQKILIDVIISSPLRRAAQTAQIISDLIGLNKENIKYDWRISEYLVGEMAGQPEKGTSSLDLISAQGAENPFRFKKRVESFLNQYQNSQQNILVVSHTGVGRMIEVITKGLNPKTFYDLPKWPNAVLIKLRFKKLKSN